MTVKDPLPNGMQNGFNSKFISLRLYPFHTRFAPSDPEHWYANGDFKSRVQDLKSQQHFHT